MGYVDRTIDAIDNFHQHSHKWIVAKYRKYMYRQKFHKRIQGTAPLSKQQKREIKNYFSPYAKISPVYHEYFYEKTGHYSEQYIPLDLWVNNIDPYFNNYQRGLVFENKAFLSTLFPNFPQPETIACRVNLNWYDADKKLLSISELYEKIRQESEIVLKQAYGSFGGYSVRFIDNKNMDLVQQAQNYIAIIPEDIIIQRPFVQHEDLARLNPSSVNTVRMLTLMMDGEVKICSAALRMGTGNARVDNANSGGCFCGIDPEGKLRKYVYDYKGTITDRHPDSGIILNGYQLPCWDELCKAARHAATLIPDFAMPSWDFSIDKNGTPSLIEVNLLRGGLSIHQLTNGPVFGKDTTRVLERVFHNK